MSSPALKELYAQAMKLIDQLDCFEIKHVLREKNREADRLANLAMDRGTGIVRPPSTATGAKPARLPREVSGIVRNGSIEFLGDRLPEGTLVRIRPAK